MSTKKFIRGIFLIWGIVITQSCKQDNKTANIKDAYAPTEYVVEDELVMEEVETNDVEFRKDQSSINSSLTTDVSSYNLKIIKSAKTKYQVDNIGEASKRIKNMVLANNGYVSEMRFDNNQYRKQNIFVVKVPNYQFDGLLAKIAGVAMTIDYENITTQDVTEAYIDAESRLKTKLEVKRRYEEILRTKAYKVKDLLEVEEKINDIQEEIEAVQGKLNYMKSKVVLSTIQIELYEEIERNKEVTESDSGFSEEVSKALKFGLEIIKALLLFLVYIWPILIILLILFFIYRKRRK